MNEQDRIWNLIARRLAWEATQEELKELQDYLQKHPEFTYSMQMLTDLFQQQQAAPPEEAEDAFLRHQQRLISSLDAGGHKKPAKQRTVVTNWPSATRQQKGGGLLANSFKVSWRALINNKTFSFVNIVGLAIGMASALLLVLWILVQVTADGHHVKKDRIYQLMSRADINGTKDVWASTPMVMAPVLAKGYPSVERVARLNWVGAFVFSAGNKHMQTSGYITDPTFLDIFSFQFLRGDSATALKEEHSLVLSAHMATALFGSVDAVGQMVKVDSNALFTVTAVLADPPSNSSFRFDYLMPWSYLKEVHWENSDWKSSSVRTFVLLKPGITEDAANADLHNIILAHSGVDNQIFVHPLRKWRLYSGFENGVNKGGDIEFVRLFAVIAGFILLIACINYMNLSTARSGKRAREVGIRKTIGAAKASLIWQFLGESIGVSLIAAVFALLLIQPAVSAFNHVFHSQLEVPYSDMRFWGWIAVFVLLTGIIAGSYPAFYLSSFRPMNVLKGIFKGAHNLVNPRRVLVVLQFTIAIVLMICTIMIHRQIDFAQKRDPGYDPDRLAYLYIKGEIRTRYEEIRNELFDEGVIESINRTNSPITDIWNWDDSYQWKGKRMSQRYSFAKYNTDEGLVRTTGLHLIAGRDIDIRCNPTDDHAVLLNESAVRLMKMTDPVGQTLVNSEGTWHIVGVVKDFIAQSPYSTLPPIVFQGMADIKQFGTMTFRLKSGGNSLAQLDKIRKVITKYNPDYPFEYYTVSKTYSVKFAEEQDLGLLAAVFTGLTIFISCLGLFGLAASMAESRVKEIGVRKVLGASVGAITTLLSKDFLRWVVISFLIASPIAWWAMNGWLQRYSYRVSLSWWVFTLAGLLSLLVAGATVSYQAIKAALANPAKSLRTE